jgi:class 3 adenylate cyclase/tetratricopeptide (TPR) repeat protein
VSACPACCADLPDGARFCPACGSRLEHLGAEATERKVVTTLFADLVGFTALGERHDPEDIDAALRGFYGLARTIVERFGGVVEKFIGDAVVGLFGVPAAHEDDAERAVRAALELVARMHELPPLGEDLLQVRCAVNTGPAVVRLDARLETGEGVLVGDAVNTCARLLSEAPPMGVVVGEMTQRLSSRVIAYEDLPAVVAKGKAKAVERWLARRPIARRGLDLSRTYGAEMVGRHVELGILKGMVARVRATSQPQLALIVGEAGAGKTRLAFEFARWIDQETGILVNWRQGRCLPYGEGSGFQPLAEVVSEHAGIVEADDDDAIVAKLDRTLRGVSEQEWVRDRLGALLGVPSRTVEQRENFAAWARFLGFLASERPAVVFFDDLHWASQGLLDFFGYLLEEGGTAPLLLLGAARPELTDHHPELTRYLGAATDSGAPIPRIDLSSLTLGEARNLVEELSPGVSAEQATIVVERSGGNPFYVEELVRLLHQGSADQGTDWFSFESLPASLQALVSARLDTLDKQQKGVLSDAAVAGQTFPIGLVAALGHRQPGDLRRVLEGLSAREFVRPAPDDSPTTEERFAFWHAMMRDAAYSQLPRRARAEKHAAAAQWLEQSAGERVDDLAEAIAHHYVTALDLQRTMGMSEAEALVDPSIHFLTLAGDRAMPLSVSAAEAHYVDALDRAPAGHPARPGLLRSWAEALVESGRSREAIGVLKQAAALLQASGDQAQAAAALRRASDAHAYCVGGPDEQAEADAEALMPLEPGPALVESLLDRAGWAAYRGDGPAAIANAESAIDLAASLGVPSSEKAVEYRANGRALLGDPRAIEDYQAAIELSKNDKAQQVIMMVNFAEHLVAIEGPPAGMAMLEKAIDIATRRGDQKGAIWCSMGMLWAQFHSGDWRGARARGRELRPQLSEEESLEELELYLSTLGLQSALSGEAGTELAAAIWTEEQTRCSQHPALRSAALVTLATTRLMSGRRDAARESLDQIEGLPADVAGQPHHALLLGQIMRLATELDAPSVIERAVSRARRIRKVDAAAILGGAALIAARRQDHDEAADLWRRCVVGWHDAGVAYEEAQALLGQGRALLRVGEADGARQVLSLARGLLSGMGAAPALAEADEALRMA